MRISIEEFVALVKRHFDFLPEIGYTFLGSKDLSRYFEAYYRSLNILVRITYSLTNRHVTIIIAYDSPALPGFSENYDNSLDFMTLFNKMDGGIYDHMMPGIVGEKNSFELLSNALKKYAMNILVGNDKITTNDLIHRNK